MSEMASLTTSVSVVCSTVCSGSDQRIHESSVSRTFVRGINRWPANVSWVMLKTKHCAASSQNKTTWQSDMSLRYVNRRQTRISYKHTFHFALFTWRVSKMPVIHACGRSKRHTRLIESVTLIRMMTSSNGKIFHVTGPLCGEFTGPGEFPTQRPVTRSFDVYFDLRLNKRL